MLLQFLLGVALVLSAAETDSRQEMEEGEANLEQALSRLDRNAYLLQWTMAHFYLALASFDRANGTEATGLVKAEMHLALVLEQPSNEALTKLQTAAQNLLVHIKEQSSKGGNATSSVAAL